MRKIESYLIRFLRKVWRISISEKRSFKLIDRVTGVMIIRNRIIVILRGHRIFEFAIFPVKITKTEGKKINFALLSKI